MDVVFFEIFVINSEIFGPVANEAPRCLHRFFHDVANLAGQFDVPVSCIAKGLNIEHFSADGGVGESVDDAGSTDSHLCFASVAWRTEDFFDVFGRNLDLRFGMECDFCGNGAADAADFSFEISDAGFACVIFDDLAECDPAPATLLYFETVFLELAFHEVAACDLELFFLGIAGEDGSLPCGPSGGREPDRWCSRWK